MNEPGFYTHDAVRELEGDDPTRINASSIRVQLGERHVLLSVMMYGEDDVRLEVYASNHSTEGVFAVRPVVRNVIEIEHHS